MIEIVSDVVCPWCFIGKRRLKKALTLLGTPDAEVHWKPFELNPGMPTGGVERHAYRARKFGSLEFAQQLEKQVAAVGAEENIAFRFDRIQRVPNTFDAHRLIWMGGRAGVQDAVVESLFQAYFFEAEDVGDESVLQRLAQQHGIAWSSTAGADEVRREEENARAQGVDAVPSFFVDGRPAVSGAQQPELLAKALARQAL
jgi:predicted DsbA family dithiol-disulfide isomerase